MEKSKNEKTFISQNTPSISKIQPNNNRMKLKNTQKEKKKKIKTRPTIK